MSSIQNYIKDTLSRRLEEILGYHNEDKKVRSTQKSLPVNLLKQIIMTVPGKKKNCHRYGKLIMTYGSEKKLLYQVI